MKKMFKIIAMFFFIAAVVFAAGCAEKTATKENETQGTPNEIAPAVSSENTTPLNGSAPVPPMMNESGKPPMVNGSEMPPMMNGSNMTPPASQGTQ